MTDNELTHAIIGAAMEVHRALGPGLLESTYKNCMIHELNLRNMEVKVEQAIPVVYKQAKLECGFRLDLLIGGSVVVELKSIEGFSAVHRQSCSLI